MTQQQQQYTTAEQADLLGYTKSDINNARHVKGYTPKPGSRVYNVLEAMQQRDITWDQVITKNTKPAEKNQKMPLPERASTASRDIVKIMCQKGVLWTCLSA